MTSSLSAAAQPNISNVFTARCQELGLPAWQFDRDGSLTEPPHGSGIIRVWLNSPALRSRIEQAARTWLAATTPEMVECFPGFWLLPLSADDSCQTGMTVVLVLGKQAFEQEWFEVICAAAALRVKDARDALDTLARFQLSDINTLVKMLRWSQHDLALANLNQQAIDQFSDRLIQAYEETNLLFKLARYMNRITEPSDMMQAACGQLIEILPFQWIAIQFNESSDATGDLANRLFLAGHLPCDRETFRKTAITLLTDPPTDSWTRLLQPDQDPLAAMVHSEIVLEPITQDNRVVGGLLAGNKGGIDPEISSAETQFLDATADFLSVFHQNVSRFSQQKTMFLGTLQALIASVDAKDTYTRGHSDRVALLSYQLAIAMGIDAAQAERVRISGLVHDVGKIGVPEAVLCKTGRLTDEEYEQIKKHPAIGYNILKDIPPMQDLLPGVLYHHERWDGKGYPSKLSGSNIPLFGRILALADTFDAMSSDRSYRSAMTRDKVINEIRQCSGSQFDAELADIFVSLNFEAYDKLISQQERRLGLPTEEKTIFDL